MEMDETEKMLQEMGREALDQGLVRVIARSIEPNEEGPCTLLVVRVDNEERAALIAPDGHMSHFMHPAAFPKWIPLWYTKEETKRLQKLKAAERRKKRRAE